MLVPGVILKQEQALESAVAIDESSDAARIAYERNWAILSSATGVGAGPRLARKKELVVVVDTVTVTEASVVVVVTSISVVVVVVVVL